MKRIASRHNVLVRHVRDLARARRADDTAVVLDGAHLVQEALAAGVRLRMAVAVAPTPSAEVDRLVRAASAAGAEVVMVTREVLAAMSPTRTPSGLVAVAEVTHVALDAALDLSPALVVAAVDVQDPGNVGAIVRAADAAGATAAVFCGISADPFGPKALRGSMGSAFRLPVVSRARVDEVIDGCRRRGIRSWATTPSGGTSLFEADVRPPCCLLLGGEGAGLGADSLARADQRLTVPMRPGVESLNVAVTAALVAYEASRRKSGAGRPSVVPPAPRERQHGRA